MQPTPPSPPKPLTIAITTGEPAGIGPDIALQACDQLAQEARRQQWRLVLLGDVDLLQQRAAILRTQVLQQEYVVCTPIPLAVKVQAGKLDARNGLAVLNMLDHAIAGATSGQYDAIVTAPLQKSTINDALKPTNQSFTGHTEYFAQQTHTPLVVMMLIGGGMRVALVTTHLPLQWVPTAITQSVVEQTLSILQQDLQQSFGLSTPRILVTGLNPHAGEAGYLGREEIEHITPAIQAMQAQGLLVSGPYPADTLFQKKYLDQADCVLAMYHDQGLTVLKYASFGQGVNVTLGLPVVRTSVDHGTALDLAGTGKADCGSMVQAIRTAASMASYRATYSQPS